MLAAAPTTLCTVASQRSGVTSASRSAQQVLLVGVTSAFELEGLKLVGDLAVLSTWRCFGLTMVFFRSPRALRCFVDPVLQSVRDPFPHLASIENGSGPKWQASYQRQATSRMSCLRLLNWRCAIVERSGSHPAALAAPDRLFVPVVVHQFPLCCDFHDIHNFTASYLGNNVP